MSDARDALNVAFWNLGNLFEPGESPRGPGDERELDARLDAAASAIRALFPDAPHLLGFAEIGSDRILRMLGERLGARYRSMWCGAGGPGNRIKGTLGLGMLASRRRFSKIEVRSEDIEGPSAFSRPYQMFARVSLRGHLEPLIVVIAHWKSDLGGKGHRQRLESAFWLTRKLNERSESSVVVMGDFNADPFDPILSDRVIGVSRHFHRTIGRQRRNPLYNPSWRFLPEPEFWEDANSAERGYPRPLTTWRAGGNSGRIFDQAMFSRRVLCGGPYALRERSVAIRFDPPPTTRVRRSGVLQPMRWRYDPVTGGRGASDHFPISFQISVREETGG